jgi:hypothetical protein
MLHPQCSYPDLIIKKAHIKTKYSISSTHTVVTAFLVSLFNVKIMSTRIGSEARICHPQNAVGGTGTSSTHHRTLPS